MVIIQGPVPVIDAMVAAVQAGAGPVVTLTNPGFDELDDCGAVHPGGDSNRRL